MINPILEMEKLRLKDIKEVCPKVCEIIVMSGREKKAGVGLKEEDLKV